MAYLPCQNQSCKSYGKPHPNCRCYSEMAKGGEARFCAEDRAHDKNCKYFAEGGEVDNSEKMPAEASSGLEVPDDIATDAQAGQEVPDDVETDNPRSTNSQKAIAGIEGFGRGFLGPAEALVAKAGEYFPKESLIPLGEKEFGFTPEDIKARQEANPGIAASGEAAGLIAGALSGTGIAGAAGKAGVAAAHSAELGRLGSNVISNMVANGLIQGGDEAGNWLLGKGDPADAVGASLTNIGAAGLLGAAGGGVGTGLTKLSESLGGNKFVGKLQGFLSGLGAGAKSTYDPDAVAAAEKAGIFSDLDPSYGDVKSAYDQAKNLFKGIFVNPVHIGAGAAAYEGYEQGGYSNALENLFKAELLGKGISVASKRVIVPVITKALESGTVGSLAGSMQHGINVVNGNNLMEKSVDALLKGGSTPSINWFRSEEERLKKRDELDEEISNGGINQDIQNQQLQLNQTPGFAEGGTVEAKPQPDLVGVGQTYPSQSMLLGLAKSRVSNYLNGIRPVNIPSGPIFDDPPDQTLKKRSYNKALDIANRPLSILDDVKKGTIDPEQIQHFQAMYPEVNQLLQKKLTGRLFEQKLNDKKPSYVVRQGLSLLLGSALSSDVTPQNIQAAQATFAGKAGQPQAPVKNKRGTSSLSKVSQGFSTPDQARLTEKQRGD